jgi:hypothetical protein
MAGLVDVIVNGITSNPVAVGFSVILLLFIFGGYLLLRRTVSEFRQGFEGQ